MTDQIDASVADAIRRACFKMADAVQQRAQELKGTRGLVSFHLKELAQQVRRMGPPAPLKIRNTTYTQRTQP